MKKLTHMTTKWNVIRNITDWSKMSETKNQNSVKISTDPKILTEKILDIDNEYFVSNKCQHTCIRDVEKTLLLL